MSDSEQRKLGRQRSRAPRNGSGARTANGNAEPTAPEGPLRTRDLIYELEVGEVRAIVGGDEAAELGYDTDLAEERARDLLAEFEEPAPPKPEKAGLFRRRQQ